MKPRHSVVLCLLSLALLLLSSCGRNEAGGPPRGDEPLHFPHAHRHVDYHPDMGDVRVAYPFTVAVAQVVRVEQIQAGCGCLFVEQGAGSYEPGTKGEIVLRFQPGRKTGALRYALEVALAEGRTQTLTFSAEVPELVRIEPAALRWQTGSEARPLRARIHLKEGLSPLRVSSTTARFQTRLSPGEDAATWLLEVIPTDTASAALGMLAIDTDSPYPAWQRVTLTVAVQAE